MISNHNKIIVFCTFTKENHISYLPYIPFISYIYIDKNYRGQRLSRALINFACNYAKSLQYKNIYIITDHQQLYKKYGFEIID